MLDAVNMKQEMHIKQLHIWSFLQLKHHSHRLQDFEAITKTTFYPHLFLDMIRLIRVCIVLINNLRSISSSNDSRKLRKQPFDYCCSIVK